ncbi:hypothetical protein [Cellulomonas aerilata]|nr:hypothetical protein [Cellulomonas aerilata]
MLRPTVSPTDYRTGGEPSRQLHERDLAGTGEHRFVDRHDPLLPGFVLR